MTIAKTTGRAQYAGNGSTTAFSFPYRFFADGDLEVYVLVDATGVETIQTLTTHYSVTNNGDETGGTVTMVTAPASGETLTILRSIPQTQSTDYAANDAFPAETHEEALDRLTLLAQQLQEEVGRALLAQASDTATLELPSELDRASMYLGFDAASEPIALAAPADTTAVTPFMATVLDDTTAETARTTLEIPVGEATVESKSSGYTLVASDRSKLIRCTADLTLTVTAAATLGDGWWVDVLADGGVVTIDPDGVETVDQATTKTILDGQSLRLHCTGTGFFTTIKQRIEGVCADVATAAELLLLPDGDYGDVTGTTTVTSIEDTADILPIGYKRWCKSTGAFTLTHHATDLICPNAENISVAAGDWFHLRKYAAGDWEVIGYIRASYPVNYLPAMHVRDEKTAGTAGGTFTSGADRTRDLNIVPYNTIEGASLAANEITLPAGTYKVQVRAPAYQVGGHQATLYNTSDSLDIIAGASCYNAAASAAQGDANIFGFFTLTAEKNIAVVHHCNITNATNGFGDPVNAGRVEVFTEVVLVKVA